MAIFYASRTFNGTQDTSTVTIAGITTNPPTVICGEAIVTDGGEGPDLWLTAVSNTSCTINTSARFSGTVNLIVLD